MNDPLKAKADLVPKAVLAKAVLVLTSKAVLVPRSGTAKAVLVPDAVLPKSRNQLYYY